MTDPPPAIGSEIKRRQGELSNLRLQAAARQKATQAKSLRRGRFAVTTALLAAGPVWFFGFHKSGDLIAACSAAWLLAVRVVFTPAELMWRRQSAYLADRYDTTVLGLPPSTIVPLGVVTAEEANAAADRYVKRASHFWRHRSGTPVDPYRKLRDWFPVPEQLSGVDVVLGCQRASAEYGRRMAVEWARISAAAWVGVVAAYVLIALFKGITLTDYLVALALPSVPSVLDAIDAAQTHRQTAEARSEVVRRVDEALRRSAGDPDPKLDVCRTLQDGAYRWRTSGPGAPDLYYSLRRTSLDEDAEAAAIALRQ